MEEILSKIVQQENKDNFKEEILLEIENYMEKYINETSCLDYDLIFRFIFLEYNPPLADYDNCIKYLKDIIKKEESIENKAYCIILLAYIEKIWLGISEFTEDNINKIMLNSLNNDTSSIIYYIKAVHYFTKYNDINKAIEMLLLSIKENPANSKNYIILSSIYQQMGKEDLAKEYLMNGLKRVSNVFSMEELKKIKFNNIQTFLDFNIRGNSMYIDSFNELHNYLE